MVTQLWVVEIYSDTELLGLVLGLVELKGNAGPWWRYVLYEVSFQFMNVSGNVSAKS